MSTTAAELTVADISSTDLISASLVYDGGDKVHIPPQMGAPREDQMQGTPAEQLCELAGRVCYDSLGKGRPSFTTVHEVTRGGVREGEIECEGYHDHIRKVGHGSVWEHFNCTIEVQFEKSVHSLFPLFNRPGLYLRNDATQFARITLNPRVVTDWDAISNVDQSSDGFWNEAWKQILSRELHRLAPHIVPDLQKNEYWDFYGAKVVEPAYDGEAWVSLFISGSRGLSHELVRHGDFTAISQRSTRFVDESESEWVQHPLEHECLNHELHFRPSLPPACIEEKLTNPERVRRAYSTVVTTESENVFQTSRRLYSKRVEKLEAWLIARGIDKTSARKQARGAARGYLGNSLATELVFSASVAQWKRILRQRASVFADAEIREMACKALLALKQSRYRESFDNWRLEKSPDGIGFIAVEQAEKVE